MRRELDFYIKNEAMHLENIQHADGFKQIESSLRQIQVLRTIALELIDFLAQLENFQKKLWLKKKFVASCHYLITLDRLPEKLLPEVLANENQLRQWQGLFHFDKNAYQGNVKKFLQNEPHLVVDTSLFPTQFQQQLLSLLSDKYDLDDSTDGVLIHADNFQALNLLQARYREQVKCIYIDPPYNTNASPIAYKNNYKDSSWNTLIFNRYELSKRLMSDHSICVTAIDDIELRYLYCINDQVFGRDNYIGSINTICNPQGRVSNKMSKTSETHLIYSLNLENYKQEIRVLKIDGNQKDTPFKRTGTNSKREERPLRFYPIFYKNGRLSLPSEEEYLQIYDREKREFNDVFVNRLTEKYENLGFEVIFPKKEDGTLLVWQREFVRASTEINTYIYRNGVIYTPKFDDEIPKTTWISPYYANPEYGTELVKEILGVEYLSNISHKISFNTAKSVYTVEQMIRMNNSDLTLDYFAGSGTTAHAVINLNRDDGGKRKYILVEQGEYFDTVLKPRVQKVVYSEKWKNGKPDADKDKGFNGVSQLVKVLKLESYEDTLNNLALKGQAKLFDSLSENASEDYLLRYMLAVESKDSLLNTDDFKNPFGYQLNIATDSAGAYRRQTIDLLETFHYLIGLRVAKWTDKREERGFVLVEGWLPNGESCLLVWRDCSKVSYQEVDKLFEQLNIQPNSNQYDVVYLNGDHNIATLWQSDDGSETRALKLRPIEPEFLRLMFGEEA